MGSPSIQLYQGWPCIAITTPFEPDDHLDPDRDPLKIEKIEDCEYEPRPETGLLCDAPPIAIKLEQDLDTPSSESSQMESDYVPVFPFDVTTIIEPESILDPSTFPVQMEPNEEQDSTPVVMNANNLSLNCNIDSPEPTFHVSPSGGTGSTAGLHSAFSTGIEPVVPEPDSCGPNESSDSSDIDDNMLTANHIREPPSPEAQSLITVQNLYRKCPASTVTLTKLEFETRLHVRYPNVDCYCVACDKRFPIKYFIKLHLGRTPHYHHHNTKVIPKKMCVEIEKRFKSNSAHSKSSLQKCKIPKKSFDMIPEQNSKAEQSNVGESKFAILQQNLAPDQVKKLSVGQKRYRKLILSGKQYSCQTCGKKTYSWQNMKKHMLTHIDKEKRPRNFKCDRCPLTFFIERTLQRHRECHSGENHKCSLCEKVFTSARRLLVHQKQHTKPCSCDSCNESFATNSLLKVHVFKVHLRKAEYKCSDCDRAFETKVLLSSHQRKHTKPHKCSVCDQRFVMLKSLKMHEESHIDVKAFHCDICLKYFSNKKVLKYHKKKHKALSKCSHCDKEFKNYYFLQNHISEVHLKTVFKCDVCGKCLPTLHRLKGHKKSHDKPYKCAICNEGYSDKSCLLAHLEKHSTAKNYHCNVCKKSFSSPSLLEIHKKSHSSKRLYCNICNKSFSVKSSMEHHIFNVHLHEWNYKCDNCDSSFAMERGLMEHLKRCTVIHKNKEDIIYKCHVCKKTYEDINRLMKHKLKHKLKCLHCKKDFTNKIALARHVNSVHKSESKKKRLLHYKCGICNREYKDKNVLVKHLEKYHSSDRLPCDKCRKLFLTESLLQKHKSIVHATVQCPKCILKFPRGGLNQHLMGMHSMKAKNYRCKKCNTSYKYKHGLKRHDNRHHSDTANEVNK